MDMSIWQALIKGLVQGLTEFLPVSSSAHLVFADHFLRLHLNDAQNVSFDVLLHLGTLLAVFVYFRKDIALLLRGAGRLIVHPRRTWREDVYARLFVLLVLGTIPAGLAVVALGHRADAKFNSFPITAACLPLTAIMLFLISRYKVGARTLDHANWKDALFIGACQACALLPGISRSGSTITGSLLRGMDREAAPRFSFLLSIPVILAGGLIDMKKVMAAGGLGLPPLTLAVGFVAAAISGYIAVVLLLGIVKRGKLDRFAYYCVIVAIAMLAYWHFLVPQLNVNGTLAMVNGQPKAEFRQGELGDVELGESMRLRVQAQPGTIPVTAVYAIVERKAEDGKTVAPLRVDFTPETAGNGVFVSEEELVQHLAGLVDDVYAGKGKDKDAGLRMIRVVLRNKLGIENEVTVPLRVVPESELHRIA